jgi:hypothetical protein
MTKDEAIKELVQLMNDSDHVAGQLAMEILLGDFIESTKEKALENYNHARAYNKAIQIVRTIEEA